MHRHCPQSAHSTDRLKMRISLEDRRRWSSGSNRFNGIMIRLRHNVSDLSPSHSVFKSHLVGRCAHGWCFHLTTTEITEDGTSHRILMLTLPPATKTINIFIRRNVKVNSQTYLHITRQISVRMMMMIAATDAPTATARTSPSTSHVAP